MSAIPLRSFEIMTGKTALGLVLACATAAAQTPPGEQFAAEQVRKGADIFAQNCSPCHGAHMADPNGGFDLRTFPHEQKDRFVSSVTKGKNSMPPWGDLFKSDDIDALWAYVVAGEKQ
jgi:mono/diheme cytochrome c family protein